MVESSVGETGREVFKQHPLTYREFKKAPLESLRPGTIVKGVSAYRLFASQDWTDSKKIARAMDEEVDQHASPEVLANISFVPVKGRPGEFQRVLVLGDNHHRTLKEWERGKKVDVKIVGTIPAGNHIGMSVLRAKAGSPFRGLV